MAKGSTHQSTVPRLPGNRPFLVIAEVRVTRRPRATWGKSSLVQESYRLEGTRSNARVKGNSTYVAPAEKLEPSARDLAHMARQRERQSAGNIGNVE